MTGPTDAERRAAAATLREDTDFMVAYSFAARVAQAVDPEGETDTWRDLASRLADFVEPACDRGKLLAMAKVLHDMGERYGDHGRYELSVTFKAIAEQIRKACGEEVA